LGNAGSTPVREATVHHSASGKFAIRRGDWVLIDAPSGDDNRKRGEPEWFKQERGYTARDQPGELFDLRQDLAERRNLYAERPEVVRALKELLEKYKRDGRSTPGTHQKNDAPIEARPQLWESIPSPFPQSFSRFQTTRIRPDPASEEKSA